jgi:hypothetical protein
MSKPLSFVTGLAVGVGATLVARDLSPALAPHVRTLAKRGIKLAIRGFERGRESLALCAESLSDVLAEVQAELQAEEAVLVADGGDALLDELLADDQPAAPAPETDSA